MTSIFVSLKIPNKITIHNMAIFGQFLDLQEFYKNRELIFENSDFDLCNLLNEFFHMNQKNFEKKDQILKCYFEVP